MKVLGWLVGMGALMVAASAYAGCCCDGGGMGVAPMAGKDEAKAPAKVQTLCPITGKAIDKNIHVDYQGKRVYFCCPGCPPEFNKDPGKYIKQMEDAGITLEAVGKPQTKCPVMGGDINKTLFADYQGMRVYFCCPACAPKFKADPQKYIDAMQKEGIVLEKTPPAEK